MEQYFARDYSGGDFVLFGTAHLIALGLVALVCVLIVVFRQRFSPGAQRFTRWGLFLLIYLCEGSWQVWMLLTGQWTVQGMLPLWLCSATSWSIPVLLVWRSRRYYEWAYFMGTIGAALALSTPDLMNYGFPHYRFIEFLTLHGLIIVAIVYMTAVEGFRPTWKSLPRVFIITNLYWALCAWVNSQIGSNYLYTRGKLPTPSLLDVLGPYPWYLLSMEALGIVLCLLMYLPWALKDQKRVHNEAQRKMRRIIF
jgi:hypothetical integral membrane protein (TIGR02206 family)